jgi:hypothetical protein
MLLRIPLSIIFPAAIPKAAPMITAG